MLAEHGQRTICDLRDGESGEVGWEKGEVVRGVGGGEEGEQWGGVVEGCEGTDGGGGAAGAGVVLGAVAEGDRFQGFRGRGKGGGAWMCC